MPIIIEDELRLSMSVVFCQNASDFDKGSLTHLIRTFCPLAARAHHENALAASRVIIEAPLLDHLRVGNDR